MKQNSKERVLITGETGYIARQLRLRLVCDGISVHNISLRHSLPPPEELEAYSTIIHCAALVHEKRRAKKEYYKINTELTRRLAINFKKSGGGLFVFLSTMAVYGQEGLLGSPRVIDKKTPKAPKGYYGHSKLLAEQALLKLESEHMRVAILRPPIVYGPDCPGNYAKLFRLARTLPVFPMVRNQRSMLHIDNLCSYVSNLVHNKNSGIFHPQDTDYHCTSELVRQLARDGGRRVYLSPALGSLVVMLGTPQVQKAFGSLVYSKDLP